MKQRRLVLITIVSVSIILVLYFGFRPQASEPINRPSEFEKKSNTNLSLKEVPEIESDWVLHELDATHEFWSNPTKSVSSNRPIHFYKIIYLKDGKRQSERDAFHFEGTGSKAYRLIVENFTLNESKTTYEIITYFKGTARDAEALKISRIQADSILSQWRSF
jgi:hypothetical protein